MRWRPVAPAGVPHLSTKDETYRGFLIPKGTLVVGEYSSYSTVLTTGNTWAALHDPEVYDAPEEFTPERFIKHKYGLKPSHGDAWRNTMPYGAGRRICLGMSVAENSLSINGTCPDCAFLTAVPKLLWAFRFEPVGEMSTDKFEPGHLTAPAQFECKFTPRNAQIADTIRSEYEEARALLQQHEI